MLSKLFSAGTIVFQNQDTVLQLYTSHQVSDFAVQFNNLIIINNEIYYFRMIAYADWRSPGAESGGYENPGT
jgi:hypothetical protein